MTKSHYDFKDKISIVTGGATGIGKEVATIFSQYGAKVVIADRNSERGLQTADELASSGADVSFVLCDVARESDIKNLVDTTIQLYGALDIVCNNAGVEGDQADSVDCTTENWERVMDINLKGLWLCMKYQIPELLKSQGGSIVNISSIAGQVGFPGLPAYVSSKHGVIGLTKTTALELAQQNIRVNAVCPGPILTDMLQRIMDNTPGFRESIIQSVPMGKIGTVEQVAETVAFLSSSSASYITGQALSVDGGWLAQ